jgi:hypothetical protein
MKRKWGENNNECDAIDRQKAKKKAKRHEKGKSHKL